MPLPHELPITSPGAWCLICGDPYRDCPTPADCGLVRPETERAPILPIPTED